MTFIESLHRELDKYNLLRHEFYQLWLDGKLDIRVLREYAVEYYHHVAAFPRYISAIHSLCLNITFRQVLLGNLIDEEQGEENNPELWQRFIEGLSVSRSNLRKKTRLKTTKKLVDGYFILTSKDFPTGLGALYAYERQTPGVSNSKIKGLIEHYAIKDERTLQFFNVHKEADEWHSEECSNIIVQLTAKEQKACYNGAITGAKLLWGFLDGMLDLHGQNKVLN